MPGKGKPFVKGQSGNPGGRPKKSRELEELIQAALEQPDGSNLAINKMIEVINEGEHRDVTAALKLICAYGYGNPRQQVEVTGNEGGPLEIETSLGLLTSSIDRLVAKGKTK